MKIVPRILSVSLAVLMLFGCSSNNNNNNNKSSSEKINNSKDNIDTFLAEVDTLIKVSNATEYVEF